MVIKVEKKVKAIARHRRVDKEFQLWLKDHPNAGKERQVKMFDAICDSVYLDQLVGTDDAVSN